MSYGDAESWEQALFWLLEAGAQGAPDAGEAITNREILAGHFSKSREMREIDTCKKAHTHSYLCLCLCIYVHYTYVCLSTHTQRCIYLSIYPSIHPCMHACIHPCMHACIHPSIHACMHASIHPWQHSAAWPSVMQRWGSSNDATTEMRHIRFWPVKNTNFIGKTHIIEIFAQKTGAVLKNKVDLSSKHEKFLANMFFLVLLNC